MSDASAFLDALEKLPRFDGITFRGLAAGEAEPPPLGVAANVVASSRDVRVATENFSATLVLALLNLTARDVSVFSARPEEAEVVVRPGSAWRRLTELEVGAPGGRVLVLEELDLTRSLPAPTEWGGTIAETSRLVAGLVARAAAAAPVPVGDPGRFVGGWPSVVPDGWAPPES